MTVGTGSWTIRIGLIAVLVLLALVPNPAESRAGKYSVVQCGWGVGKDADWAENATERYNHSALCVPPGSDIWGGVEIRTYTRPAAGSAAAATTGRWRWTAPQNTLITNVRGTWWHQLFNQFQHRLGGMLPDGKFSLSHSSASSRGMEAFAAGFSPGVRTFESRLICARAESKRCDTSPSSSAMVRALTITLAESLPPAVGLSGRAVAGDWLSGGVNLNYAASDQGSGMRIVETLIDGARLGYTEHACELAQVGGVLHGRKMLPCPLHIQGTQTINTAALSDGHHMLSTCVTDFAGNRGCTPAAWIHVDNTPPAAPSNLKPIGGEGWRRSGLFEIAWENPDQGAASPITAATYRVFGPGGYDSGDLHVTGPAIARLRGPELKVAGEYRVDVRLHDQAGHSHHGHVGRTTVRFDDLPPEVGFRGFNEVGMPERIRARIADAHSGPAAGTIMYRRAGEAGWVELPTTLEAIEQPGVADLVARFPSDSLEPDRYEFRALGRDAAGNSAESSRMLDGSGPMTATGPLKTQTRLDSRLESSGGLGTHVTAPFDSRPLVTGRLTAASGAPLAGRRLRISIVPEDGARLVPARHSVTTGEAGEFHFQLERSTSRRIEVRFAGDDRLAASRAPDLDLDVAAALSLRIPRKRVVTGQVVNLRGQVETRDAVIPGRGKLVAIQYWERRARRWRPVVFARTDAAGAFRARYRFRYISRGATVKLRAVALAEPLWPYAPGVSAATSVRVLSKRRARALRRAARSRARKARAKATARDRKARARARVAGEARDARPRARAAGRPRDARPRAGAAKSRDPLAFGTP